MRANSKLFWFFTGGLLLASCMLKGWLINQNTLTIVNDVALARAALDPMLNAEQKPRILIAGGSNALASYDSAYITQTTGIPTFNLALLNEGYNYRNTFEIIESRARSNDIVLLSTVRLATPLSSDQDNNLSLHIIGNDHWQVPQLAKSLPLPSSEYLLPIASMFADQTLVRTLLMWSQWHGIEMEANSSGQATGFVAGIRAIDTPKKIFNKPVFDQRGDWINCTTPGYPRPVAYEPTMVKQSEKYLVALDQFANRLQSKGVILRVTPATILVQRSAVPQWQEQYLALSRALHTAVVLPVDSARQLLTDPKLFCDSSAHLLRSQIGANNRAVVETVKNLTDDQAIVVPARHADDGAV